jgi:hypothetical protein
MPPLLNDLHSQASSVRSFILKATLLLILFIGLDRILGRVFLGGLDRYYGLNEPAAVLCVGHSHTVLGIDKVELERQLGVPVAKFAVEGANTADRLMMIRYYFSRQPKSVRAVVYDVDGHTFTGAGLSSSSYQLLFPFIDDPEIRAYIKQNCISSTEYWLRRLFCLPRYNELTLSLAVRGYLHRWTSFKFGKVDVSRLANEIREGRFRHIEFDQENSKQFEKTVAFVCSQDSSLFLAYLPTIDVFNAAEPEKFGHTMEIFKSYAATNSSVNFLDYNETFQSRHELFRDPIHLNRDGQKEVTARLAADLRRALEKRSAVDSPPSGSSASQSSL